MRISVVSGKGGTGKTVLSVNLAIALSRDNRVLLIDADIFGSGSASHLLGLNGIGPTLKDVIIDMSYHDLTKAIHKWGNLDFIPAGASFDMFIQKLHYARFRLLVEKISRYYHYIIIDGPAQLEEGFIGAMRASQRYLVVLSFSPGSIEAAVNVRKAGVRLNVPPLGFVINQPNASVPKVEKLALALEKKFQEMNFPVMHRNFPCLGILPYDKDILKEKITLRPTILSRPRSKFSKEIWKIAYRIQGKMPRRKRSFLSRIF